MHYLKMDRSRERVRDPSFIHLFNSAGFGGFFTQMYTLTHGMFKNVRRSKTATAHIHGAYSALMAL